MQDSKNVLSTPKPENTPNATPWPGASAEPKAKGNTGMLLLVLAVVVIGGGAGYYFNMDSVSNFYKSALYPVVSSILSV
jgi:uncharacterized protein HemX